MGRGLVTERQKSTAHPHHQPVLGVRRRSRPRTVGPRDIPVATRNLTLNTETFTWTGQPCARYDRLIPFSFLILVDRFATLAERAFPASHQVRHPMTMVSSAASARR
jgi:hypothetical protein